MYNYDPAGKKLRCTCWYSPEHIGMLKVCESEKATFYGEFNHKSCPCFNILSSSLKSLDTEMKMVKSF